MIYPSGIWGYQYQLTGPCLSEWNLKLSAGHNWHLQRQMPHKCKPTCTVGRPFTQTPGNNKDKTEPWSTALCKSVSCVIEPGATVFRATKFWGEVLNSKCTLHRRSGDDCVPHYLGILISGVYCLDVEPELVPHDPALMLISLLRLINPPHFHHGWSSI